MSLPGAPRVRAGRPAPAAPLIGRERELEALVEAARRAPAVVVLDGEAGIGKTRLAEAMMSAVQTDGVRVLAGRCHRLRDPFALGPVVDALRALEGCDALASANPVLGALRPLLPELAPILPPQPALVGDAGAARHQLYRALVELFVSLGPAVCVLEDLHWADDRTLEFLRFLLADPPPQLVLVVTYRTEQLAPSSALMNLLADIPAPTPRVTLRLAPLCASDVGRLAAAVAGREAVSQQVAARLHAWTGGIPFAVTEVLQLLRERDDLDGCLGGTDGALDDVVVPRSIGDGVLARVAGLGAAAAEIAAAAAVLATPADESLLTGVAGLSADAGATGLVEALSTGLLTEDEDGLYGVRHGLAAQAICANIAGPRRRRLHLRAGRLLESAPRPPLAEVARHLRRAGAPDWARHAERAADAARARGDDLAAARLLETALEAPDLSQEARARMALVLSEVAFYGASAENAISIIRRILEVGAVAPGPRAKLRFALAVLLGHAGEADAWRDEALATVAERRRCPELAVQAMVNLARPEGGKGDLEDGMVWLQRASDAASGLQDPATTIAVVSQRAAILLSVGDRRGWAAVRDIPPAGDSAQERQQLLRGYHAVAMSALGLGYHDRADSILAEAERIQAELGRRSPGLWLTGARASIDWFGGSWDGLEDRLHRLREETVTVHDLHASTQFLLGALLLARGQLDAAGEPLESALDTGRRSGGHSLLVTVSGRLARLHLERGDVTAAWDAATAGLDAVRSTELWLPARTVVPEAVAALLMLQRPEEARALVTELASGLSGRDAPAARAALAGARGAVAEAAGRPGSAAGHFARAEAGWRGLHNRYEAARARERRACCMLAGADDEAGRELLPGALDAFQGLGATRDARRVRAKLIAQGVWRGGRRGYGDELSPREAQVARLAAAGKTNRAIAQTLFISPRTVEVHVAAALQKLGVRSRHALATHIASELEGAGKDT